MTIGFPTLTERLAEAAGIDLTKAQELLGDLA